MDIISADYLTVDDSTDLEAQHWLRCMNDADDAFAFCAIQRPPATEKAKPAEEPDDLGLNSVTMLAGAKEVLAKAEQRFSGDYTRKPAMALAIVVELEIAEGSTTDEDIAGADRAIRMAENAEGQESSIYAITLGVRARVYGAIRTNAFQAESLWIYVQTPFG